MYNIKNCINIHITKSITAWCPIEKLGNYIVISHQDKHMLHTYIYF